MKVLIVDDDAMALLIMTATIRQIDDADPVTISNPIEALRWLEDNTPDLIVVDQVMPEIDGIELIKRIRARMHLVTVPILMVTADDSMKLRVNALGHGCSDFLNKPILIPELLVRAQNLLTLRLGQNLLREQAELLQSRVEEATTQLRQQAKELVGRLVRAAEYRDPETGVHIERIAFYARLIAERLGMDPEKCSQIAEAAPMHDIGKIGVPDAILLKPGKLSDEEMSIMRKHASIGYSILRGSNHPLIVMAAEIAATHHERYDGLGYPNGISGTDIPLAGRIVAVADVFDALTTARPYKLPWTVDEARIYLMENRGTHFDPDCVDAFLDCWSDVINVYETLHDDGSFARADDPYL